MSREEKPIYYAGIGSRKNVPIGILDQMETLGYELASQGWILRSGAAKGCDLAFEGGCDLANGKKEIFLPWQGFNESTSPLFDVTYDAMEIAKSVIPWWDNLSNTHKLLHGRNVYQILGKDLNTPVSQVLYWAELDCRGIPTGGTGTGFKLAKKYGIDIERVE